MVEHASTPVAAKPEDRLKPDARVSRFLISSPAYYTGHLRWENVDLTHAWTHDRVTEHARRTGGPHSRNFFVFSVEHDEGGQQVVAPDVSWAARAATDLLSLWYGKRWDYWGRLQAHGILEFPKVDDEPLNEPGMPFHHHESIRADFPAKLSLNDSEGLLHLLERDESPTNLLLRAAHFYAEALRSFNSDPQTAYLNLITSLEVLSAAYDFPPEKVLDSEALAALAALEKCGPDAQKALAVLKPRIRQLKRRILLVGDALVTDGPFAKPEAKQFALEREKLGQYLAAAYDLRSLYLHAGEKFGGWLGAFGNLVTEGPSGGKPVVSNKDLARALERAPTFLGLERLVRHQLLRHAEVQLGIRPPS